MDVEVRDDDPELHEDRAIRPRHVEQGPLAHLLDSRELLRLRVGQVTEILHVTPRDEHRVPSHRRIGIQKEGPAGEVGDELG